MEQDIESILIKQEYLLKAEEIQAGKSSDFRDGFEAGTNLLSEFHRDTFNLWIQGEGMPETIRRDK